MATEIKSCGSRHGIPELPISATTNNSQTAYRYVGKALIVDVRKILPKNPYHNKKLRKLRGDDDAVIAELEHTPGIHQRYYEMREIVRKFDGPVYVMCTGGHHRSVYIANRLGKDLEIPVTHLNYEDK